MTEARILNMRWVLIASLVLIATACLPKAGNDLSLVPKVRWGPSNGEMTVTSGSTVYVAAFAVVAYNEGWSVKPIPPLEYSSSQSGEGRESTSFGTPPRPPLETPPIRFEHNRGCHGDASTIWNECDLTRPIEEHLARARGPSDGWSGGYVLIVAADASRSLAQWKALADSVGIVPHLGDLGPRLGALAFPVQTGVKWAAVVHTDQ